MALKFSRQYCFKCKDEMLHKMGLCIHCNQQAAPGPVMAWRKRRRTMIAKYGFDGLQARQTSAGAKASAAAKADGYHDRPVPSCQIGRKHREKV